MHQGIRMIDDCRLAEEIGSHSLRVTEHRFWHDGYRPSLTVTLAAMAAATRFPSEIRKRTRSA